MAHTLQERYSPLILAKLRASLVLKDGVIFNNDYEGSPSAGSVKIPVRDTEVVVGDYNKASGIAPGSGTTTYQTMLITKDKAVNEIIDGYDAASVPDGIVAERLDSAGYSLAKQIDSDGAAILLANGLVYNSAAVTSSTIYDLAVDVRTVMSKANVPAENRYLLVTPDAYALMLKDKDNFIRQGDISQALKASGAIGQYAGFAVYEWNDSTANLMFIAGHPKFATRANEFSIPVFLQDLNGDANFIGASAVKGRMVYDHKVLRSAAIRPVYAPASLTLAAAAGSTDPTATIVTVTGAGTYKYRINPAVRAVFGQAAADFTAMTSGTTEIPSATGDIIEVVKIDTTVSAVGYIVAL